MIVQANDNRGINTRYANASVIINVQRNQPPFFLNLPYNVQISERQELNQQIYQVTARDNDLIGDIVYTVLGDSFTPGYFTVNPDNGAVTAISDLRPDRTLTYTVRFLSSINKCVCKNNLLYLTYNININFVVQSLPLNFMCSNPARDFGFFYSRMLSS